MTSHPHRQLSDSEDEVDEFRGFVVGRLPIADDLEEFKADYDTDDLDFDEGDEKDDVDYQSFRNNKRTPNSVRNRLFACVQVGPKFEYRGSSKMEKH